MPDVLENQRGGVPCNRHDGSKIQIMAGLNQSWNHFAYGPQEPAVVLYSGWLVPLDCEAAATSS
jgi:hypothetical protein